ncbi:MAG: hypothetical protein JNN12_06105 [Bacteroidetes Order II. Incertae sedis bacterium]|nr:hypothetical protein [Bacteroidetes Order II. bacterium]
MDLLRSLIARQPRCFLQPRSFFVAWCGVPMLTYQGFPNPILALKAELEQQIPQLLPENPGSKWPGTTLGALRPGYQLTLEQLKTLRKICTKFEALIEREKVLFALTELQYVLFKCRSLEERILTAPLPLRKGKFDTSPFTHKHLNWINHIHSQFDEARLEDYLPAVRQWGHRADHYRDTFVEATLIWDLPEEQPGFIKAFMNEVEDALPGYYVWFSPNGLHVTIRALGVRTT